MGLESAQWVAGSGYCWIPPPTHVIKANFDASVWDVGQVTVGCVFRNDQGKLLLIAGFLCEYSLVDEAETEGSVGSFETNECSLSCECYLVEGKVIHELKECDSDSEPSDARGMLSKLDVFSI